MVRDPIRTWLQGRGEIQSRFRLLARGVRAAVGPVGAPGLERCEYGVQAVGSRDGDWTAQFNDRTYKLFFLLGHPRSGTNWTGKLLNRHPKIFSYGEFRFEALRYAYDTMEGAFWHGANQEPMRSIAEECFRESVQRILVGAASRRPEASWIGDRTPRSLLTFVAQAPHILVLRDPRDVLTSLAYHQFAQAGQLYEQFAKALDPLREEFLVNPMLFQSQPERLFSVEPWFRKMARMYNGHVRDDLRRLEQIETGELNARVHVVRYERMHADPEAERAKMYRFLGEDPAEAEPLTHDSRTVPGFQEEKPDDFYRKGKVGDWQAYFTADVKRWFLEETGDLLLRLAYAQDDNW